MSFRRDIVDGSCFVDAVYGGVLDLVLSIVSWWCAGGLRSRIEGKYGRFSDFEGRFMSGVNSRTISLFGRCMGVFMSFGFDRYVLLLFHGSLLFFWYLDGRFYDFDD